MKIALTGRHGSGKDYLADYLLYNNFTRVSFSDQLKLIADKVYPWGAPHCGVLPEEKEFPVQSTQNVNGLTYRELWKSLDVLRQFDPKVFARGAERDIKRLENQNIVITDIRKQIEYDLCVEQGFTIIKICNIIDPSSDESEDIIDTFGYDFTFDNEKDGLESFVKFITPIIE